MRTVYYETNGQWIENKPYSTEGRWDVNYSDILTQLIQSAGRYCQRYASDLFIDWANIVKELDDGKPINNDYIFAFRTDGVDHKAFYNIRKTGYHEVWKLTIETEDNGRWMKMKLELIEN